MRLFLGGWPALAVTTSLALAAVLPGADTAPLRAATPLTVEVTNAGDSVAPGASTCPDPTKCTLRRAIELVNADVSSVPYVITFKPSVFLIATPPTISVAATPLPPVTRGQVTIDGSQAGVRIDGSLLTGTVDGLVMTGDQAIVRGLAIHNFSGACLAMRGASPTVGGDALLRQGNTAGNCGIGLAVAGAGATVTGNTIGFAASGPDAMQVTTGILITVGNAAIGSTVTNPGLVNVVANATGAAIQVGDGAGPAFTGVVIARNTIGRNPGNGDPAPVGVGVDIRQRSNGTLVTANTIASAATGIRVAPDLSGLSTTGNRFQANRFEGIGGLAIDLKGDGLRNPNDDGDADAGPNAMLNHPTITRAVQSRIAGSAGSTCAGCQVQLYLANHEPGGVNDYGASPLSGGMALTDAAGDFAFDNPPVTPGQWVIGLVTDANGNTSEFGPSVRLGAGVVQCGNAALRPGWNHSGFFGPETATLGMVFPAEAGSPSKVSAIYHLEDGLGGYTQWLAGTSAGRTLDGLQTGEAYWFLAAEGVTISGGFALNVPLPVQLKAGWNDFVYIGATADVRDALGSIAGKYRDVYRWVNDGSGERWSYFGTADTPDWARDFTSLEACGAYAVYLTEDATLTPLQP